jgi:hypothetical protein
MESSLEQLPREPNMRTPLLPPKDDSSFTQPQKLLPQSDRTDVQTAAALVSARCNVPSPCMHPGPQGECATATVVCAVRT